jgi:hypothetical protein
MSSWSSFDPTAAIVGLGAAAVSSAMAAGSDLASLGALGSLPVKLIRPPASTELSELAQLSDGSSDEEDEEEAEEVDEFDVTDAALFGGMSGGGMSGGQDSAMRFTTNPLARVKQPGVKFDSFPSLGETRSWSRPLTLPTPWYDFELVPSRACRVRRH